MTSSSDSSSLYTSAVQSGTHLLMQHSHPTLAFKLLILFPPTLYLLLLHPHHRLMLLAVSLYLVLPFSPPLTPSGFFNGVLGVSEPGALNCCTLFCLIPLTFFVSRNLTSIYLPLSGFSALRADGTHSRSGIFSIDVTDASGGVIIFVRQGLSFSELSTDPLSSLDPYSDYVEVNIFLNDSFSLSFLNVYTPLIRSSKDSRINFFSPSILPSYVEAVEFSRFHRKRTASTSLLVMPNSKMVSPFKSHPPIFSYFSVSFWNV